MINGVVSVSVLNERATQRNYKNIAKAPHDIQLAIFRETLSDLENYLDTSDLRKLTSKSLGVIRDDILEIIKGIRELRTKLPLGTVKSLDGSLEEIRMARDSIQVALGMFDLFGRIDETKSKELLAEMRTTRTQIERTLQFLHPM